MPLIDNLYSSRKYPIRFAWGTVGDLDEWTSPRAIEIMNSEQEAIFDNDEYRADVLEAAKYILSCGESHCTMLTRIRNYVRRHSNADG